MEVYGPYLKTATLLVGVLWLWDWGYKGPETLSPGAFALVASSSMSGADGSTCGAIRDSIRRIAMENRYSWWEYAPGQIGILLKEDDAINEAILAASQAEETVTGIASFDSVSSVYGLISLHSTGEWSSFYKRRFMLIFPEEADLVPILRAYEDLPYMELVSLNSVYYTEEPLDIWAQSYAPWEIEILLKDDEVSAAIFAASQTAKPVTGITSFDSVSSLYGLICLHSIHESSSFYKQKFTLIFPLGAGSTFEDGPWSILRAYGDLPYIERVTFSQYRTPIEEPSAILDHSWGRIKSYRRK